ncbi:hypothetical protein GDO81_021120 [Engystomops pustulosus]|uniref:Uncharacterized protein n=1 Tax=Engystomops pustulosus TaxID=76066 RepID=A0AAV6ZQ76_ENGPU|nr:hypothetical protein GDO81_021120 [Engystomops pustulosus]
MTEVFHKVGTIPHCRLILNKCVKTSPSSLQHVFRTLLSNMSGPPALLDFIRPNSSTTSSTLIGGIISRFPPSKCSPFRFTSSHTILPDTMELLISSKRLKKLFNSLAFSISPTAPSVRVGIPVISFKPFQTSFVFCSDNLFSSLFLYADLHSRILFFTSFNRLL